jgi:hypothetical protein
MPSFFNDHKKRAAIITTIVFLLMMSVPVVLIVVYNKTSYSLTSQKLTEQQTLTGLAALALKIKLDNLVSIASSYASAPQLVADVARGQWTDAADVARDLGNSVNFYDPFIDRLIIYDASGTQQAAYPALTGGLGTNASGTAWYAALSGGSQSFYVSNVTKRISIPQIQVINISVPIRSTGGTSGFLALQIPTDNFLEFGGNLSLGAYGFAYIVDSVGTIVAHPRYFSNNDTLVSFASVPEVQNVMAGMTGTDIVNDQSSGKGIITYQPVPQYGWGIIAQEPYAEAFSNRSAILDALELLIIAISIINVLIAYMIFRLISSPHKK